MRLILVFLFVLMLSSCEYFKVKKTSSDAILKEELQTFNWNDVDEYPSFSVCDSITLQEARKRCFQSTLTNHIWNFLEQEQIIVSQDITDTIILEFRLSKTGNLELVESKIDSLTQSEIPNIQFLIDRSLDSLPKIYPAIKRGQQVTTEFSLPIIVSVN